MQALKQSTAVTLKMGPFVSSADGVSPQTGLTITQPDVRLSKNGGNFAQKSAVGTATHDEFGYYDVSVSTTDTDTLGRLKVAVYEDPALPVWQEFMVMPANVWDSLYGADKLQVDMKQINGGDTSANNATLYLKQLSIVNNAGDAIIAHAAGGNGSGIWTSGNGAGAGVYIEGGATGHGLYSVGGTSGGSGIRGASQGANGSGIYGYGSGGGYGIIGFGGQSSGTGIAGYAGNLGGIGIWAYGNGGTGMVYEGAGSNKGLLVINGTSGFDISATATVGAVSAYNLNEVTGDTIGSVSAYNLGDVIIPSSISANNLSEVDITGQSVIASASNLSEVNINGQTVSASNLSEVDITGQSVVASASNLSEVDVTGQTVSASNLNEVDITGQSVIASASNLSEVDINGQVVSASNLSEVDITGQTVSASNLGDVIIPLSISANNLSEVDITGQSVIASASNLSEVDITGQSVIASASNLSEVNINGQSVIASASNLSEVNINGQSVSATNLNEIDLSPYATSAALQVVDNNVDTIVGVLPAGGDIIAGQNDIEAILVNTRFKATVPSQAIVPEAGYYPYELIAHLYNLSGTMEDPDNDKIYVQIKSVSGTDYKNQLYDDVTVTTPATSGTNPIFAPEYYEMVKVDTGYYHTFYKVSASEPANQWIATFGYVELSATQFHSRTTIILQQTPGASTLADNIANKTIIRESMGYVDGSEASIDDKLNSIYADMGTSATQEIINNNVLITSAGVAAIPTNNNGITVSANNLSEVDINGQTVSASNLDEIDLSPIVMSLMSIDYTTLNIDSNVLGVSADVAAIPTDNNGITVSASNLSEVDINGQTVSASNLSEVDINGQTVSASNLGEVTGNTIGSVSAYNLSEVDINGQTVSASNLSEVTGNTIGSVSAYNLDDITIPVSVSAYNLSEVDINGQTVSASNLSEVNINGQSVSANNLDEIDLSGIVMALMSIDYTTLDIHSNVLGVSADVAAIPTDNNGITVSASNLSEVAVSADCYVALENYGVQTSAYADVIKAQIISEINDVANEILISATVDGSVNVISTLINMLAYATGKIIYSSASDEYTYYKQDNSTSAYIMSGSNDTRVRI